MNEALRHELARRRMWFLDRDGTLTLADQKLPHVDPFLAALRRNGRSFRVVTNNSSKSPRRHWENFRRAGLDIALSEVLVSIEAALRYLAAQGIRDLHLVANTEVTDWTREQGFTTDAVDPQAVLLTYDTELNYRKLRAVTSLLRRGVPLYATHLDIVCPTPEGPVPDIGTTLATLSMTLGTVPVRTFGKPAADLVRGVLDEAGLTFDDAVIVGDRLYTDIALADGNAMRSVLVLTGETTAAMHAESTIQADLVVPDLSSLVSAL